jgi:hypothetical protein
VQLLEESVTFDEPYTNLNFLRRNLQKYTDARWIRCFQYATTSRGTLNYYKLTRDGFRLLHQDDGTPEPTASYFAEIPVSRQEHSRALADVIVCAIVAGHRSGIRLTHFCPENQLTLSVDEQTLKPDFQMTLEAPTGQLFKFLVELDNSTEPLEATDPKRESIQRKLVFYERFQEHWLHRWRQRGREGFPPRFRVLLFTRSTQRVRDMLAVARTVSRWRNRRLCYAVTIEEFLAESDAVRAPIFLDHFGCWQGLMQLHPPDTVVRTPVRLPAPVQSSAFV